MSAAALLSELARRGVSVTADGDALILKPRRALDGELLARIRENKPEIIRVLSARPVTGTPNCYEVEPGQSADREATKPDPYECRMQVTLSAMCENYPSGNVIVWLEHNAPLLYDAITRNLPNLVDDLWNRHAALEEFDAALAVLLETHRQAVTLYREGNGGRDDR
ncbi:MAG: hypothetical protein ACRD4X_18625 [Candidatus Acidiferrales bacterium]